MAEGAAVQEGARGRARRAPFPWGLGREVPYRRSQEEPRAPGTGAGCSKKDLRQAQGLGAQAGGLGGLKKGDPRGLPGQPGPRSSPDSVGGGAQQGGHRLSGPPLLSPWKGAGEPVVQIYGPLSYGGEAVPKGDPWGAPPPPPGPPPPSSVQPLLVTVGTRQEGSRQWACGPCSLPRSPCPGPGVPSGPQMQEWQ